MTKKKIDEGLVKKIESILPYPVSRVCHFCGKSPIDWDENCQEGTHQSVSDVLALTIQSYLKKEGYRKVKVPTLLGYKANGDVLLLEYLEKGLAKTIKIKGGRLAKRKIAILKR